MYVLVIGILLSHFCFNVFLLFWMSIPFPPFSPQIGISVCVALFVLYVGRPNRNNSFMRFALSVSSCSPNTCLLLKCFRSLVAVVVVVGCVHYSLVLILVCSLSRLELPCVRNHTPSFLLSLSHFKGACVCALKKHNSRWLGNNKRKESLTGERDRVDVLAVIADGHLGLTKTDRVLSGRDTIELLELSLINKLDGGTRVTQGEN